MVYVRHNATHLLSVNEALLQAGLVVVWDFPNEFDSYTWPLYVYHLTETTPPPEEPPPEETPPADPGEPDVPGGAEEPSTGDTQPIPLFADVWVGVGVGLVALALVLTIIVVLGRRKRG